MALKIDKLNSWKTLVKADKPSQLAAAFVRNVQLRDAFVSRETIVENPMVFSDTVTPEGAPVTNQKASGRCWLFAATNMLRVPFYKKYNVKEFQLSTTYLFFYDKLEKANFFLDQIIDTHAEPVGSRLVQHLLSDPVSDGGQFDMFLNIVNKYGLVPNSVFPDTAQSLGSQNLNFMVKTKLREFAEVLRNELAQKASLEDVYKTKEAQMQEIHRILCIHLGEPPSPNEEFVWQYVDKDDAYHRVTSTPLQFLANECEFGPSVNEQYLSLLHDPRNEYNKMIKIDRLGNMCGGKIVSYLNMEISVLEQCIVNRIKANKPVFFGSHTPLFMNKKHGIMDLQVWDYELLGCEFKQQKASRLLYHQSLMTHAMLITGVHVENGEIVRYKVENSWGSESGKKGYYVMTKEYFREYCYQIVVEKSDVEEHVHLLETEPIVLPPYDPCGSLALCGKEVV